MRLDFLLTAALCVAVAGCGKAPPTTDQAHADWVVKVDAAIKDPARARRVAEQGVKLIDEEQSMAAALKAAAAHLGDLNKDYNATPEQVMAAYSEYEKERKVAQTRFRDAIFAMRKQVSAEEWKQITK